MSEESGASPSSWIGALAKIFEGGVPQVIAGPAGKAISRLVAGAADIPAAWLEKHAQSIRDEKDARSATMKAIGEAAAKSASSQPELVDRAVERFAGDLSRKQDNREGVARLTVGYLKIDPPPLDAPGPTDDWMNVFERHAEDASSEDFRDLWARILAGEIRKQGSYGLKTLQIVSTFDKTTARLVEKCLQYAIGGALPVAAVQKALNFEESFSLQDFGIYAMHGQFGSSHLWRVDPDGFGYLFLKTAAFRAKFPPNTSPQFPCYVLTRAGREIATTLNIQPDINGIALGLWDSNPRPLELYRAPILATEGEQVRVGGWISVPSP
ncbi:hypothetical protein M2267_003016 [Ensifer sp. KUDG1]|uniref:DUF2806 domain-containing protein n=1 Tax=Ensifer sp. KUDG1 TaxID=3373919 RepID=UPI003D1DF4F0